MKKKIITLLAFTLLLSGCGEVPKLQDGKDAVISFKDDVKISIDTMYKEMKDTYALGTLIDLMDKEILEKEYKNDLEKIKEEADAETQRIKDMFGYDGKNYNEDIFLQYLRSAYGVNTVEALEKSVYLNLLRDKAAEDYTESLLKEKEMKAYYDKEIVGDIRASHILITSESESGMSSEEKKNKDAEALKKAEELIKKLKESKDLAKDFEKLAKENSEDPRSKDKGGDLDFFNKDVMVKEFENAAYALKKGEMTDKPIKTEHGYHIILKTDEKEKPSFEDSKDKVISALVDEKLKEQSVLKVQGIVEMRKKYNMKIEDSSLAEQYSQYMNYLINTANDEDKK